MRLKALIVENFRSYRDENRININQDMTGVVGKNDAGKSTILEALEIFFNNETIKIEPADLNINAESSTIVIGCVFDDLPDKIIIDQKAETNFSDEFLLNSDGDLEVVKKYKIGATAKLNGTYIKCIHPSEQPYATLLSAKIANLKQLGKDLGVDGEIEDQRVSSQWRRAIWRSQDNLSTSVTELDVDEQLGTDAKKIWSKIQGYLPTYALFKSDRESSDVDPEAKSPMQAAVKQAQQALQAEIEEIQEKIESSVMDVAKRTLEKLQEMDPHLAKELKPKFKDKPKWTFNFTLDGDEGIPINKRGSGVRRLILLNFFRAEAEKKKAELNAPRVIYAIEEPETSQHPNYQQMLMRSLIELSLRDECQILVTTHVPALAGMIPIEGLRYVTSENDETVVKESDNDVLAEATESLGILPEPGMERASAIVMVEGKSDCTFLHHAADTLNEAGIISDNLRDKNIVPIPIGGCGQLKHWVTMRLADDLGLDWCVFFDSDIGGDPSQIKAKEKQRALVESHGKKIFFTKKREIENYIHPEIVESETGIVVEYTVTCDAKSIIGLRVGMKTDEVAKRFWPLMKSDKIQEVSKYVEDNKEHHELEEVLSEIIELVDK